MPTGYWPGAFWPEAQVRETGMGRLRVISAEGLIGFKLQAFDNNPARTQDIEDIRALLRANRDALNMSEVKNISCCSNGKHCSVNSPPIPVDKPREPPLVREGGAAYALPKTSDPYSAWMQLMEAVEALCPRWPARAPTIGGLFRL